MRWPFLVFLLCLLASILSLALLDRLATSRLEFGPIEAVRPDRNPLFAPPSRS